MQRPLLITLATLVLAAPLFATPAAALCPVTVPIVDTLSCSESLSTFVDHTAPSLLGGECAAGECYSCGDPWAEQAQIAPEAVYTFTCQVSGSVSLLVTDLSCDLDIYVLDDSCDPNTGCVEGSTASFAVDDGVIFTCTAGETYYVVVEAYGTAHLDIASGPCTDSSGAVYSPSYTLSFDVSESTGCPEDCDDGLDNDLDGVFDCADSDCSAEPVCCDLDDDGWFGAQCGGDDCDDGNETVWPGAPEDGGSGTQLGDDLDNDCDGDVDEGMLDTDDDGDGKSEVDGDCNDDDPTIHPGAIDIAGNGLDEDCDGADATGGDDDDDDDDDDTSVGDDDDSADDDDSPLQIPSDGDDEIDDGCGCSSSGQRTAGGLGLLIGLLPLGLGRRRR